MHGPTWAPTAFDAEPKDLNPCKVKVGKSVLSCWDIGSLVNNADKAGAGAGWKFGPRKDFICSEVGILLTVLNGILQRIELDPVNPGRGTERV